MVRHLYDPNDTCTFKKLASLSISVKQALPWSGMERDARRDCVPGLKSINRKRSDMISMIPEETVLLIHLGGLGDMCLSESTILSLSQRFDGKIHGLGYTRFLGLFREYFAAVHAIESARWLYLFSDDPSRVSWKRIIFIGKDRNGEMRKRWQSMSRDRLIFIEMYPDEAFSDQRFPVGGIGTQADLPLHIEDYQLAQLKAYCIKTVKKTVIPRPRHRALLYPETGFAKSKWHPDNFVQLYHRLKKRNLNVSIFESFGLKLDTPEKLSIEDLSDMEKCFEDGGIFVSNDSGMAHLAGSCGLTTITVFSDFDPALWHPRGDNIALRQGMDRVDVPALEALITGLMEPGT
ncbi:MAG: Glycosyltransferase family 9 (heptosyltransferase) [Syntrophorhabdus sp. PtaU1.Bin153]|nr:MAG: Glycosyltransferase family 9 (heptosyltransferase) [Syntrophorhabdus sp. PtaU1.Bin153]